MPQLPFKNHSLPGRIEIGDFDEGGEGVGGEGGLSGKTGQSNLSFFIASRMTAMYCVAAAAPLFTF